MTIVVKNQKQLDAALKKTNNGVNEIVRIDCGATDWLQVPAGAYVELAGSSRVEAWGSSSVVARGSSRVVAWGSSRVVAWGSSSVVARESSSVVARESSSVVARESSRVEAWGSSSVVASKRVAVQNFSKNSKILGGCVIDCTAPIVGVDGALDEWGIKPKRGRITVYKAVNKNLVSGYGQAYEIGSEPVAKDYDPTPMCGKGLHFSPTPSAAGRYHGYDPDVRYLECSILVKDAALCTTNEVFPDKLKAKRCKVIREVDVHGDPV